MKNYNLEDVTALTIDAPRVLLILCLLIKLRAGKGWHRQSYWAALSLSFRRISMLMNIMALGPQVKLIT